MTIRSQTDALRGSLDLLILKTLSLSPMHGWGISLRIEQTSEGILDVNLGSLYPALHRLEDQGLIASFWGTSENNRKAKYYRITPEGRKHLTQQRSRWETLVQAVTRVLGPATE